MNTATAIFWKALADPTRRAILDMLADGPATTSMLVAQCAPLTRFAVMKHLKMLEAAQLVTYRRQGKHRFNYLNPLPIKALYRQWSDRFVDSRADLLLAFRKFLSTTDHQNHIYPTMQTLQAHSLAMDISIEQSVDAVWQAFTEAIDAWWPADMRALAAESTMHLEAHAGGRLYESLATGAELYWGQVISIQPRQQIEIQGVLSPDFGGPAISFLKLGFAANDHGTILHLTDHVMGAVSERTIQSLDKGWKHLFVDGLKAHVE